MISAEFLTRLRVQAWDAEHLGHWQIANTLRDALRVLTTRFIIVTDDNGYQYLIPAAKNEAWHEWMRIPHDDERSLEHPAFAKRVEGELSFIDPKERV